MRPIIPILLMMLMLTLVSACGKLDKPAKIQGVGSASAVDAGAGTGADTISTFKLVGHSNTGRKKWQVEGESANLLEENVTLSPVRAVAFGQVEMHLTAKTGTYTKSSQNSHLEKEVVLTTSDGARLTTESFDWYAQRDRGTTADWVKLVRPGMTVTGQGAVAYPKLKKVRVNREITVTLEDSQKKHTTITCDGPMLVDYAHRRARFWRNVKVQNSQGNILSERMDVVLHPQTNQILRAKFFGHVVVYNAASLTKPLPARTPPVMLPAGAKPSLISSAYPSKVAALSDPKGSE